MNLAIGIPHREGLFSAEHPGCKLKDSVRLVILSDHGHSPAYLFFFSFFIFLFSLRLFCGAFLLSFIPLLFSFIISSLLFPDYNDLNGENTPITPLFFLPTASLTLLRGGFCLLFSTGRLITADCSLFHNFN